jgi:U1 small nuclear ribonucleoprotein
MLQIVLVHDKRTSKPRGYAFIEYEHERDMHCKYFFSIIPKSCGN